MPVTLDQFAAAIKKKRPQYANIPDDKLVQAYLTRFPQYKAIISGAGPKPPKTEMHGTREDFTSRVLDRIGGNIKGMAELPVTVSEAARKRFLELHPENAKQSNLERLKALPGNIPDLVRSHFDAMADIGSSAAKSTLGMTGPGVMYRQMQGEDPANITGDALMFFAPGGEELGRGTHEPIDATKAGPLRGSMTRAKASMDAIEGHLADQPVHWQEVYNLAQKVKEMGRRGFTVPKQFTDYLDFVDSQSKNFVDVGGGKVEPASGGPSPLSFKDARQFSKALGEAIPWELDRQGIMNGFRIQMRNMLERNLTDTAARNGLRDPYLKAKANFEKAYGAEQGWRSIGKVGAKLATYGSGVPHPWVVGHVTGPLGEHAAGSMVRSLINAGGESELDMATRRGTPTAGIPPLDRLRMATDQLNLIRQRMQQNPGNFHDVTALRAAEDAVTQATKDVWGPKYAGAPKTVSGQGGGGANYTAEDLAALKKRMGIPMPAVSEPSASGVAMKMFVTKADEAALRGLGYTDDVINKMKPDEASNIIRNQRKP